MRDITSERRAAEQQLVDAIQTDDVGRLRELVASRNIDINKEIICWGPKLPGLFDYRGAGLLHIAVHANSHNVMKWLIGQGIKINQHIDISQQGATSALGFAGILLSNGWPKEQIDHTIDILLRAYASPQPLLQTSAHANSFEGVKRAVEAGADVNWGDAGGPWDRAYFTRMALLQAVSNENPAMIEYLIAHNANVNGRPTDPANTTPLMLATSRGDTDVIQLLLKHDANPGRLNHRGESIFHFAADAPKNTDEILNILLAGRDKSAQDLLNRPSLPGPSRWSGATPLVYAILRSLDGFCSPENVAPYLRHGAQWRDIEIDGQPILHSLIKKSRSSKLSKIIEDMLQENVDPFQRNKEGITAYDAAMAVPAISDIFINHWQRLNDRLPHFNPAADPLLDARGNPTALVSYACYAHLLDQLLAPSRWAGKETSLIAAKLALAKALPEHYATQYDALLDVTANRRAAAPRSWLKRYTNSPPETRARTE